MEPGGQEPKWNRDGSPDAQLWFAIPRTNLVCSYEPWVPGKRVGPNFHQILLFWNSNRETIVLENISGN